MLVVRSVSPSLRQTEQTGYCGHIRRLLFLCFITINKWWEIFNGRFHSQTGFQYEVVHSH